MRTTLQIDDDVLDAARSLARSENRTVGEVISELARRGLQPRRERRSRSGFPVFAVPRDAPPLTPEMVRNAADEDAC
jgi:hypothetical protein